MQKRKLFIICAILIIIPLIGLSAQCAANTEDKIDVSEDEKGLDETPTGNDDKDTASSEDEAIIEDETDEADSEEEADVEAPTISLAIYSGPTLEGSICYYRIEATVTGSPSVSFSKDDSAGAFGSKKAQVNLNNSSDTYTLTATATNSEGSATDSIDLSWGCEAPEPGPDIHEEDDVSSGMTSEDIISIGPVFDLSGIVYEGGSFLYSNHLLLRSKVIVGDEASKNLQIKAYISFDIKELHGKTVQDAEIRVVQTKREDSHPESYAKTVDYKAFNYGSSLDAGDFKIGGTMLERIPISSTSYTISGDTLKSELQMVIDDKGRDYFQLKLGLDGKTNNNGFQDDVVIDLRNVSLNIRYSD